MEVPRRVLLFIDSRVHLDSEVDDYTRMSSRWPVQLYVHRRTKKTETTKIFSDCLPVPSLVTTKHPMRGFINRVWQQRWGSTVLRLSFDIGGSLSHSSFQLDCSSVGGGCFDIDSASAGSLLVRQIISVASTQRFDASGVIPLSPWLLTRLDQKVLYHHSSTLC